MSSYELLPYVKQNTQNWKYTFALASNKKNGVDCGIFAVANAYYILSGIDVSSIRIDENKMRMHFLQCFEQGRFELFPEK